MDLTGFKMIYKEQVFNVVDVMPTCTSLENDFTKPKVSFIDAFYIDENGELKAIHDESFMFKFVRR